MLIEELIREFGEKAYVRKVRCLRSYRTLTLLLKQISFEQVIKRLTEIVKRVLVKGEEISCKISRGDVRDMGLKTLEILRGKFLELYDYEKLCLYFVRVYEFKGNDKKWIAIYVDENLETPWWNEKERKRDYPKEKSSRRKEKPHQNNFAKGSNIRTTLRLNPN